MIEEAKFFFENVDSLHYYLQKIDINRSGSYIDSPEWIKDKKATINPKNTDDNNCFQYSITAALNHKDIGRNPQRISRIKPFINKYNRKDINFPAGPHDWKKIEQNNRQLQLIYYMYPTILKKYVARINQNIIMNVTIK